MIDTTTTTTDRARVEQGTTVTLVYSPQGSSRVVKKFFKGLTEDDVVAVTAALAARRVAMPELHDADMEQLRESRERQLHWYTDRLAEALAEGMGRWFRWAPKRVRKGTLDLLKDYLRDFTATLTSELIAAHAEANRTDTQIRARRLRPRPHSAPENGPRILCVCCDNSTLLASLLPEGWTSDADGVHCPKHPAGVVKESTG
jgi:hypothetical protein